MIQSPVYISGPMSGLPDFNRAAFHQAAHKLRALGYEVINPAEQPERTTWEEYMRHDIKLLMDCRSVVLLPGWAGSRGARIEVKLADNLGINRSPLHEVIEPYQHHLHDIEQRIASGIANRGDFLALADYVDHVKQEAKYARG